MNKIICNLIFIIFLLFMHCPSWPASPHAAVRPVPQFAPQQAAEGIATVFTKKIYNNVGTKWQIRNMILFLANAKSFDELRDSDKGCSWGGMFQTIQPNGQIHPQKILIEDAFDFLELAQNKSTDDLFYIAEDRGYPFKEIIGIFSLEKQKNKGV